MKRFYTVVLAFIFCVSWVNEALASHAQGADLTYQFVSYNPATGQMRYVVIATLYRDCSGIAAPNPMPVNITNTSCAGGTYSFTANLPMINGLPCPYGGVSGINGCEVSQLCPLFLSQSTCNGGTAYPGVQKYVYRDTITLPGTTTSSNFCSQWLLSVDISARNNSTNLSNVGDLYNEALINNSIDPLTNLPYMNSSAVFGYDPVPFVCSNNPVSYNNGASDPNGDSLVFQLIPPLQAHNSNLSYAPGYSVATPIKVINNQFVFNTATGQIDFTPSQTEIDALAMKVLEYRNGVLVGSVIRDVQVKILPCSVPAATQYPIEQASLSNANLLDSVTIQLCPQTTASWDIKMTDANGDSIVIKSNILTTPSPLPGATLTKVDSSRSVVTAHFTWTPQISDTGCHYYQVTTNTIDCPVEGNYTKSYRVCVFNKVTVTPHQAIYCGTPIQLSATGGTNSHWSAQPAAGLAGLSFPHGVFTPVAAPSATTTYTFASDCGSDTTRIIYNPPFTMSAGPGGTICQNSQIQLNASVDNLYAPYDILWIPSTGLTDPVTNQHTDSILNPVASPTQTTTYTVKFTANTGCVRTDSVKVTVNGYAPAIQAKANPTHICPGQLTTLTAIADPPCGVATTPCPDTTTYRVGTGTSVQGGTAFQYPSPYGNYYKSARHQFLFHASEIASLVGSGGTIKSLAMDVGTLNSGSTLTNFTIRIGCVDASIDSLDHYVSESDLTTVFVHDYKAVNGWNTHIFDTPYNWDGHSNLVVDVCFQNTTSNNINNKMRYTVTPFRSVWFTYTNAAAGSCGFTGSQPLAPAYAQFFQRPNMKFNICVTHLDNANLLWTASNGAAPVPNNKDTTAAHPLVQTTYHVTLTDPNGCTSTDFVTVYVDTTNRFSVYPDTFLCSVNPVQLHALQTGSANPNALLYTWTASTGTAPPSGTGLAFANPTVTPTATTLYTCVITGGGLLCSLSDTARVTLGNSIPINKVVDSITCSGANNGRITINMNAGVAPYTYTWNPAAGSNTNVQSSLGAGTYYVTVVDRIGCTGIDTTKLLDPAPLTLRLDSLNPLCFNGATGSVTATVSGGRGPYRYTWNPARTNTSSITALVSGPYQVTVKDTSGCTISGQVTLTQPAKVVSSVTTTNLNGTGTHDGTIKVHTSGGTAPYSYTWTPNIAGNTDTVCCLDSGRYVVQVCDANGCCVRDTGIIRVPPPIDVVFTITNNKCFGFCNGAVSAVATGGVLPYTYSWSTNPVSTLDHVSNLCAGSYTLIVTDSNGITVSNTVIVTAPDSISMAIDSTPITCFGANNGKLNDRVSGGTAPYTITWSQGPNPLSGLSPGVYTVTVSDANNCTATDTARLGEPDQLRASINSTDSVKCYGQSNGIARLLATGGRPPYTYLWSQSGSVADSATDLPAGTQNVIVTDASGCTTTVPFTIYQPLQILVNVTSTLAHCATSFDGTATATVTNGTSPYTYSWDGTAGTTGVTALGSGPHTVIVSDVNGCSTTQPYTVDTQYVLHISLIADSVSCYGGNNGRATATVLNGNPGYTYLWTPSNQSTNPANGLTAGVQTVTVTDLYQCIAIDSVQVYQPAPIVVVHGSANPLCYGDQNGKLWLSATGGQGPYTYLFRGVQYQMTDTVRGLGSGTYFIAVMDNKGCPQQDTVVLTDPAQLAASLSYIAITCANANNGLIRVGASGGTPAYSYTWNIASTNDSVHTNLAPGDYIITVTDANGCTQTVSQTLIAPPPIVVISLIGDSTNCPGSKDGHISIEVLGGTPGSAVPYRYSLDGITWQDNHNFYDLGAGVYHVYVIDSQLCQLDTTITIYEPEAITAAINPSDTSIIVGTGIQLTTLIGNLTTQTILSYAWSPATGLSCIDCPNPVAAPYQDMDYILTVVYGKNCIVTTSGSVRIEHGPDPYIPNAFTPNGDGANDEFSVFGTKIKTVTMRVFNRWGEKVFDSGGSQWASWDGTYKGVGQSTGVYVYVVDLTYLDGVKKTREGSVTLIR